MKLSVLIIIILGALAWHETSESHDTCWVRGDHLFVAADEACDIINGKLANCTGARVECHMDPK